MTKGENGQTDFVDLLRLEIYIENESRTRTFWSKSFPRATLPLVLLDIKLLFSFTKKYLNKPIKKLNVQRTNNSLLFHMLSTK